VLGGSAGFGTPTWIVLFTRDDRHLLTASDDGNVRLWDWRPGTAAVVATSVEFSQSVALSPDRRWLSMGAANNTTLLVRCPACAPLGELRDGARRNARALTKAERKKYLHEGEEVRKPY
jgi:hypothetical protein